MDISTTLNYSGCAPHEPFQFPSSLPAWKWFPQCASELQSTVEKTQLCFVFTSLGAKELVSSECITFTHDFSVRVWSNEAPDLDRALKLGGMGCLPVITACVALEH